MVTAHQFSFSAADHPADRYGDRYLPSCRVLCGYLGEIYVNCASFCHFAQTTLLLAEANLAFGMPYGMIELLFWSEVGSQTIT